MTDHIFEDDDSEKWGSEEQRRERFLSWQQVTWQQFSYVTNLLWGVSTASIPFEISFYLNDKFSLSGSQRFWYSASLILLVLAVGFGMAVTFTRLLHFQNITWLARKRWDGPSQKSRIKHFDNEVRRYRWWSWRLLLLQMIFFTFGVAAVAYVFFLKFIWS